MMRLNCSSSMTGPCSVSSLNGFPIFLWLANSVSCVSRRVVGGVVSVSAYQCLVVGGVWLIPC
jgi:hypothetical protein